MVSVKNIGSDVFTLNGTRIPPGGAALLSAGVIATRVAQQLIKDGKMTVKQVGGRISVRETIPPELDRDEDNK